VSNTSGGPAGNARQQGIAAAITEVSERASVLIREEIELAKTEIAEKTTRLAKGAIVAIVAGVFFLTALFFVLIGCAWLLYYELPIGGDFTYFWGFFAMAVILVVLGVIAGLLAAKAVKASSPPAPTMAIEEARKIRETVSSSSPGAGTGTPVVPVPASPSASATAVSGVSTPSAPAASAAVPPAPATVAQPQPQEPPTAPVTPAEAKPDSDDLGRGTIDGPTLGS
jgi:uncharacterized membrane protein YqjE